MTATPITNGATLQTWCSKCKEQTPHVFEFGGKPPLKCERCEKESEATE